MSLLLTGFLNARACLCPRLRGHPLPVGSQSLFPRPTSTSTAPLSWARPCLGSQNSSQKGPSPRRPNSGHPCAPLKQSLNNPVLIIIWTSEALIEERGQAAYYTPSTHQRLTWEEHKTFYFSKHFSIYHLLCKRASEVNASSIRNRRLMGKLRLKSTWSC